MFIDIFLNVVCICYSDLIQMLVTIVLGLHVAELLNKLYISDKCHKIRKLHLK